MDKQKYNPNAPETEEDGLIAGKLRFLKVRQQFKELTGRTHNLLPLPNNMQPTMESTLKDLESLDLIVTSEHIKLMNKENLDMNYKEAPINLDSKSKYKSDSEIKSVWNSEKNDESLEILITGLKKSGLFKEEKKVNKKNIFSNLKTILMLFSINSLKDEINNFYNKIWEKRDFVLKNESKKAETIIRIISRSLIILILLLLGFAIKEQIQGDFPIYEKVANGAICNDGWTSESQGPGTCSYHGGVNSYIFENIQIGTHFANPTPYYYAAFILTFLIILSSIFQRSYRWVSIKFIVDILYWTCFMLHKLVLFIVYIPYILFFLIYLYIHPIIIYFRKKESY